MKKMRVGGLARVTGSPIAEKNLSGKFRATFALSRVLRCN